ncbi:MAG: hypothetical protein EXR64_01670 [Dehalococcoidia bacterium]|nr:hypothetical protein [Dehalococcoidia bacterium]
MTFPCPVCNEELLTPRFTDDGVMICPLCGEEIEAPEGWGRLDNVAPGATAPSASGPAAPSDVVSQLERAAALRDRGALTAEEFAALKAKLLAG